MLESTDQTIEILLVDDHALFREGVCRLLAIEPAFNVVACASIKEALAILRQRQIDLVLVDFDLGERDGGELVRTAKEQGFKGKILIVTAGVDEREAAELIRSGISGIFMKQNSAALLAQGIHHVMAGKIWFDQELIQATMIGSVPPPEPVSERFTQREYQVLSYVFEGLGNKEIAARIGVSESSVKATLQQLFSKTGVHTRGQLVRIAIEQYRNHV